MGKSKESKFEQNEILDTETNEELKKIDEVLERYKKLEDENKIRMRKASGTYVIEEDNQGGFDTIYYDLPRAITNNELPEVFYKDIKDGLNPISQLLNKLELMEISDHNDKIVRFFKSRPTILKFDGCTPYASRGNYDGKTLYEKSIFKDCSIEEKGFILEMNLETNKDLLEIISHVMAQVQSSRLDFDRGAKDSLMCDSGVKSVRWLAEFTENKKYFSDQLHKKVLNLDEEFTKAKGGDIEDRDERRKILKERFPTQEDYYNEVDKLNEAMLGLFSEEITEIKQKMRDNYEAKKVQ